MDHEDYGNTCEICSCEDYYSDRQLCGSEIAGSTVNRFSEYQCLIETIEYFGMIPDERSH
jgi:hypothetical protein